MELMDAKTRLFIHPYVKGKKKRPQRPARETKDEGYEHLTYTKFDMHAPLGYTVYHGADAGRRADADRQLDAVYRRLAGNRDQTVPQSSTRNAEEANRRPGLNDASGSVSGGFYEDLGGGDCDENSSHKPSASPQHPLTSMAKPNDTSELGHPANRDKPYPLTLVPFDIANPPQHEESLIIRPYDDIVSQYQLRDYWVEEYEAGRIGEGVEYEDTFVLPYLRSFYQRLEALKGLKARRGERLQIFPTNFMTSVRLDLGGYIRPGDTVKDTLDGNGVEAKEARKRKEKDGSASQVTSTTAKSRMPDVGLVGHHLEQIAGKAYRKPPREEPSTKRSSGAQISTGYILYSIIHIKWSPRVKNVRDQAERRHLDDINLRYARLDALFQTLYHLHNAYRVAGCRLAIAWANEFFTRMVNVTGKCGPQRILVEASPKSMTMSSKRLPNCAADGLSLDDLITLVDDDDWEAPNSLIQDHDDWHYDEEAKYRLDATILMTLAMATRATTLGDVVASGGSKRGREVNHDECQESSLPSKRSRDARQGVVDPVKDSAPSRPASSLSVASSALSPNNTDGTNSVIDKALLKLEPPSEDWSHGDYAGALEKTGMKVVLVGPQEMDVLLARAAGQGWAEALKME